MAEPLPILSTPSKGDTERDTKETPEKGKRGLSLSQCIVREMQSEPDRSFVVRDIVEMTGGSYHSVKRILARLSSTGKGAGPVRRNKPGLYQFALEKERDSLQALARSGNWKVENLTFVSLGAQGGVVSLSETVPEQAKGTPTDSSQSAPHTGYPWNLETGHKITWEDYQNGTQVIHISANGSPPLSPDHALTLIGSVKNWGMDESWKCNSLEINIDSRAHRIDGSYSLQLIEGVLLKAYQHGYVSRIEIADRQTHSMREITDFLHSMANTFDGQGIIRQVKGMGERLTRVEKKASHALDEAVKVRDGPGRNPTSSRKKAKEPGFSTAANLRKQEVKQD